MNEELVATLITMGVLKTPRIIEEFQAIDRAHFVPEYLQRHAYANTALPIGLGQTISQPYTVAFMLELLQPMPGQKILDLGSGSGWSTALLAHIAGEKGYVIGVELLEEIALFGEHNLRKYNFPHAEIRVATDELGAGDKAPFDRILASAAAHEVPQQLIDQLRVTGILVMPVASSIVRVKKRKNKQIVVERYEGFAFVPLKY